MRTPSKSLSVTKSKTLLSGAVLALGALISSLQAADSGNSLYLRAEAGLALQQGLTLRQTATGATAPMSFDRGIRFDVAVGYHLTDHWATEFQTGLIYNSVDKIAGTSLSSVSAEADFKEVPLMANLIYQLRVRGPVTVYAGGGVGGVAGFFYGSDPGGTTSHTDWTLGYQGIAGLKYSLNGRADVGITYKFLSTTDHDFGSGVKSDGTRTHAVLAAFTFKF